MSNDAGKKGDDNQLQNFTNAVKTIMSVPKDAVTKPEPQKPEDKQEG